MNLAAPITFLRTLPVRFADLESSVSRLLAYGGDIRRALEQLVDGPRLSEPTYVYVLPPQVDGERWVPMAVQSHRVPRGTDYRINFNLQHPVPAGTWIVAVGPAAVRGVRVGNISQESMFDYNGHVCQTRDPLEVGTYLGVNLRAE